MTLTFVSCNPTLPVEGMAVAEAIGELTLIGEIPILTDCFRNTSPIRAVFNSLVHAVPYQILDSIGYRLALRVFLSDLGRRSRRAVMA